MFECVGVIIRQSSLAGMECSGILGQWSALPDEAETLGPGFNYGQGFHYDRPLPITEMIAC
jgi:hypothetical protein